MSDDWVATSWGIFGCGIRVMENISRGLARRLENGCIGYRILCQKARWLELVSMEFGTLA